MKRIAVAACLTCSCLVIGCGGTTRQPKPLSPEQLGALEKEVLLQLPAGTRVLHKRVGDRDPQYGYHLWLLYFPDGASGVKPLSAPEIRRLTAFDVEGTAAFVKSCGKPNMDGVRPHGAEFWTWEADEYNIRGNLLQTDQGDYLVIERFNKRE